MEEKKENFEMDIVSEAEESEDDEEEELFIRKSENGAAKRPLIKGRKKRGGISTEIRTGNPAARRCCGPVCWVLLGIKTVMGLAALTIILTNYFTHADFLFWNFGLSSSSSLVSDIRGCDELEVVPVWQVKFPKLLTEGNTRMVDVNGDGVADVILGYGTGADGYNIPDLVCQIYFSGQTPCLGGVLALDGRNGLELWRLWTEHEVFSLTCQADLDGDNVTDCLAGGRAGVFLAVSLKTGSMIWQFEDHAIKSDLMSVFAAQFVSDLDNDGVQDILAVHGGDPLSDPAHRNMYGRLILFSGADGRLLRWAATPDRRESYYPPQVMTGPDGRQVVIFATGGNMNSGALYAISLLDLYRKRVNMTRLIYRDYAKGILSPALLADVTGDGLEDIIVASINSNVMAFDGTNYECVWNKTLANFESITSIAAGLFNDDDIPDIMVKYNYGSMFPVYEYQKSVVLSGHNGSEISRVSLDSLPTLASPLTLSLTGTGNDMFIHWSSNCEGHQGKKLTYKFREGTHVHEQSRADLCRELFNSPSVAKLTAVSSTLAEQEIYNSTFWASFEHVGAINTSLRADEYLARHPEIMKLLEESEDEYSVLPYKNKNYDDALKLLEEEMSREYGDGQPFIDPGSIAYENLDYNGQVENESNERSEDGQQPAMVGYPSYGGQLYGNQVMAPPQVRGQNRRRRRQSGPGGSGGREGLSRQTGTGSLAPPLLFSNDTIDIVFPTHWIYPPKMDILQKEDIDCIENKLRRDNIDLSEDKSVNMISEIEEECLKSSGHFARQDGIYETPSDYDPLSINMGQLIVYRFTLRCKCDSSKLGSGQSCARILPFHRQGWPAYMGRLGDSVYRRPNER